MGKLAIACSGQGAQHSGMFDLALQSEAASQWLSAYSDALSLDVVDLARKNQDLFSNRHAQILICGASVATWLALADRLVTPDVFLGYSVGEISAYGCAGVWNAQQLAFLIDQRAVLMNQAAPLAAGLMAVKGLNGVLTDQICSKHHLEMAILNADDHVILGGARTNLAAAADELGAGGYWFQLLDVAVPAHTSCMQDAAHAFRIVVEQSGMKAPTSPVLAGVNGCETTNREEIADTLAAQIAKTVRWQDCMRSAVERGVSIVLELGPGRSLSRMFNGLGEAIESRSVEDFRTLEGVAKWVDARSGPCE